MSRPMYCQVNFYISLAIPVLDLVIEVVSNHKTLPKDSNKGVRKGFFSNARVGW